MSTFAAVLALAMLGFGNAFYIMSLNVIQPSSSDAPADDGTVPDASADEEAPSRFTGGNGNFLMALIYSFRTGLGDFSTDGYDTVEGEPWLWIIFLLCAILIQIILLNLLIAIMGDTYGKVTEI